MKTLALALLLALTPSLHAAEPAKNPQDAQKEAPTEVRKKHSDPRFHGKVEVIGKSSESYGERPKDNDLTTRGFSDDGDSAAPQPLPAPVPVKK